MSISEQIKELRTYGEKSIFAPSTRDVFNQAADTIESLSEKLQAANMERSAEDCRKSVLKIETPKVCIDCPCHFAGESGMVMCGVEKRELLSDDIETFKPDWCPLRESSEDCGGWIPCSTGKMPDMGSTVLIQFKSDMNGITGDDDRTFDISYIRSRDNSEWFCSTGKYPLKAIKAWRPIKSYHKP